MLLHPTPSTTRLSTTLGILTGPKRSTEPHLRKMPLNCHQATPLPPIKTEWPTPRWLSGLRAIPRLVFMARRRTGPTTCATSWRWPNLATGDRPKVQPLTFLVSPPSSRWLASSSPQSQGSWAPLALTPSTKARPRTKREDPSTPIGMCSS